MFRIKRQKIIQRIWRKKQRTRQISLMIVVTHKTNLSQILILMIFLIHLAKVTQCLNLVKKH